MANNYDKILELANANNMGLSNTIKRDFGIPLDFTSVQANYEAAVTYAAKNTLAYVGQPISVGDKLYIVTATSQGKYPAEVEEGQEQLDVFLAEVGSATDGDNKTIELRDGVLSLYGIDGKATGTYVPTLVNGVLTWNVPDNTTVDGLTASVDALNLTVFGKEAEGEQEKVDGLVDKVDANTQSIADNADAIADNAEAIENITKAETGAIAVAVAAEAKAREDADKLIGERIDDVEELIDVDTWNSGLYSSNKTIAAAFNWLGDWVDGVSSTAGDAMAGVTFLSEGKADIATTLAGYGIGDAYTKTEADTAIATAVANAEVGKLTKKIVDSVDVDNKTVTTGETTEAAVIDVIYMVKDATASGDMYREYMLIGDVLVQTGDTTTDLGDYVTNDALTTTLEPYAKTADVVTNTEFTAFEQTNAQAISDARTNAVADVAAVGYALEESVASRLAGKVDNATLDNYYTKTEADGLLGNKADAEATTNALATKVESATITHTSEGVSEGVTKDGTNLKIVVDSYTKEQVYTKSETDAAITAKINSVTGGESAADVKLALEDYRDALNTEIWGADAANWTVKTTGDDGKVTVTYTPQYGTTSRVDTLEAKAATLETNVQKAQKTADDLGVALTTLETTKVDVNTNKITAIENEITKEGGLSARIGALESANTTHTTEFATLKAKVDTAVDTTIPALTVRVGNNESAITAINNTLNGVEGSEGLIATVGKKANASDVYTKGEVDTKVITGGSVAHGDTESVAISGNNITVTVDAYTKAQTEAKIAEEIGKIDNTAITNNSADITTLVGADKGEDGRANKSVRAIAKEEVALVVGAAPEALNTLEEVAQWIENDETGAAAMASDINTHKAILAGFVDEEGKTTTVASAIATAKQEAIDAATYTLEVATADKLGGVKSANGDNKVTVANDGTMSVGAINVNTLVQTDGDVFILDGGHA